MRAFCKRRCTSICSFHQRSPRCCGIFPPLVLWSFSPPSGAMVLFCPLMPSWLVFTCFLWLSPSNQLFGVSAGCRGVEEWAMSARRVSAKSR